MRRKKKELRQTVLNHRAWKKALRKKSKICAARRWWKTLMRQQIWWLGVGWRWKSIQLSRKLGKPFDLQIRNCDQDKGVWVSLSLGNRNLQRAENLLDHVYHSYLKLLTDFMFFKQHVHIHDSHSVHVYFRKLRDVEFDKFDANRLFYQVSNCLELSDYERVPDRTYESTYLPIWRGGHKRLTPAISTFSRSYYIEKWRAG